MKAIISSTFDDMYFFFIPIVAWCWNKLGVDVACCIPIASTQDDARKINLLLDTVIKNNTIRLSVSDFYSDSNKAATYAQCSRLYGSEFRFVRDSDYLIISDVDMAIFNNPFHGLDLAADENDIDIWGADLVPQGQFPMCYIGGRADAMRKIFNPERRSLQVCLDNLLGDIECDNMRGNYWAKDQETAYNLILERAPHAFLHNRARPGTQFASNRIDRDDMFWADRMNRDIIDAHLWRPGYTEENFHKILALISYFYPDDNLGWMIEYRDEYLKIIGA